MDSINPWHCWWVSSSFEVNCFKCKCFKLNFHQLTLSYLVSCFISIKASIIKTRKDRKLMKSKKLWNIWQTWRKLNINWSNFDCWNCDIYLFEILVHRIRHLFGNTEAQTWNKLFGIEKMDVIILWNGSYEWRWMWI